MNKKVTDKMIKEGAAAIANARANRKGAPSIANILEVLPNISKELYEEVIEDAELCLKAALKDEID